MKGGEKAQTKKKRRLKKKHREKRQKKKDESAPQCEAAEEVPKELKKHREV